jgi:hypothetical protein
LLTAIAAFAETFANPLAPVLVLCFALLLTSPALLRLVAAGLGSVLALPHVTGGPADEIALAMVGSTTALLLYAELMLFFVLPALRLGKRCVYAAWDLAAWIASMLLHRLRRSPAVPSAAVERDEPPARDPS